MFRVIIELNEVAQSESLADACRIFISKTKEMISNGGVSAYVLYETCMIKASIDGAECIMNFDAIVKFSHRIGILQEDGCLSDRPAMCIPKDIEEQIFLAADNLSRVAYIMEQLETLSQVAADSLEE